MEFNPNKTVSVNSTRSDKSHPDISFGHTINYIDCKQNHCHLGLILQSNACWSEHITNIFDRACQRLNVLRTLKYKLNRESLTKMYISFIRPILEYGDVVWDNCTQEQTDQSIRKCTNRGWAHHYRTEAHFLKTKLIL